MLTLQNVQENSPELLRNAIDQRITRVRPMSTPIDQITRHAGSRSADSMEVAYYLVDSKPTQTLAKQAFNLGQKDFKADVGRVITFNVESSDAFDVGDTIMFPTASIGSVDAADCLTAYVLNADNNRLTIAVMDAVDSPDSVGISVGDPVVRMGRAAAELDVMTGQYNFIPRRATNYCQIFKAQVEQSILVRLASKEVNWTFSEQEEAAVVDMRLGMEKNFIFGHKTRVLDSNKNEFVYLTGGIWNQAGRTINLSLSDNSPEAFITFAKEVFTGNNGSRKRLLIGGSDFIEALSKVKVCDKITLTPMTTRWGLETRDIVTNFGSLSVIHSEVFDQCGHSADAMVIDDAFITKYVHIPFRPERIDLRGSGVRNTDAVVLTEASCVILRNPAVHARVLGV